MDKENIDYDALKKKGFLRENEDGLFTLRTRAGAGNYTGDQLAVLSSIAKSYGRDVVHLTVRQGAEIPFIKFKDMQIVEKAVNEAGMETGTSGPRLRATTACPGNNWCKRGLVNTFAFFDRIEKDLGLKCGMELPHKFKIVISGCPNTCTRAQASEIGLTGAVDVTSPDRKIGYAVYLGGCGGLSSRQGFKLDKVFSEDEALQLIAKVVGFFKENAKPRQRLALLIEEYGKEKFLQVIGQ